jgi:hypothetical protein
MKYLLINSSLPVDERSDTGAHLKAEFKAAVDGKLVGEYNHQVEFHTDDIAAIKKQFPNYRFKQIFDDLVDILTETSVMNKGTLLKMSTAIDGKTFTEEQFVKVATVMTQEQYSEYIGAFRFGGTKVEVRKFLKNLIK